MFDPHSWREHLHAAKFSFQTQVLGDVCKHHAEFYARDMQLIKLL